VRFARAAIGAGIVAVAGCSLLYDVGELRPGAPPGADADADGASSGAGVDDPCVRAAPPPRPTRAASAPERAWVFALDHFAFVADVGRASYDLDGLCTCDTRPGSREGGASSCAPRRADQQLCDGEGGRDNATASMFASVVPGRADGGVDVGYDSAVRDGRAATLVEIGGYNGLPDDDEVTVAVYDSPGLESPAPCSDGTVGDGGLNAQGAPRPDWGGCDRWKRSTESLFSGNPRRFTRDAWVSAGTLVARFSVLPLYPGDATISVHDVVLTARVRTTPPTLADGVLAGRITSRDFLAAFGEQRPVKNGPPLCLDAPTFSILRAKVCDALDLPSAPSSDGMLPRCDSASLSMELSARAALLGVEAPPAPRESSCVDAGDFAVCP
jgi:hypothetical protein